MRLLRKIFGGISLTAAMFVFQACYGTDPFYDEVHYTFRVVEADKGQPLENVKVESQWVDGSQESSGSWMEQCHTDSAGIADVNLYWDGYKKYKFRFTADDSTYAVKDTMINSYYADTVDIVLTRLPDAK